MTPVRGPREVLGVDEFAGRADIVAAYRRLAMRWHPDRNPSPEAKDKFQEIQRAYQTLRTQSAPRNMRALWEEMTAAAESEAADGGEDAPEIGGGFRANFPFAAAACAAGGALAFALAAYPGDWIVFSLSLAAADGVYKTGDTRRALQAEAALRLALRLYWLALLAFFVWTLARKAAGI